VEAMVNAYTAALERWVRKYPGQYFWHHRRWKHQQPGTPPELGDPS
jgi:lauroyl/myristoyl acyltransferase